MYKYSCRLQYFTTYNVDGLDYNDKEVNSKNIPKLQTKTAQKTIPFGVTQTYTGQIRYPLPTGLKASFTSIQTVGKGTYAAATRLGKKRNYCAEFP